jgi:pyruvate dehydrogenase E2 component (dihydrolipoamide acetyltransferase)
MTTREFVLPDLGEGLTESEIVSWRIAEGETVELNQVIAEVETAKALVELPSPVAGVVARLHAEPGTTVSVGQPLVTFELDGGEAPEQAGPEHAAPEQAEPGPAEQAPPPPREATLVGYGAAPESTDHPRRRPRTEPLAPPPPHPDPEHERVKATPPVRQLAHRLGVDVEQVTGSGPDGFVTREDVETAAGASTRPAAGPSTREGAAEDKRIPVHGVRKRTAEAMVRSAFSAPHASVWTTVDVTATMELLERVGASRDAAGIRVTVLAAVARAVCLALRRHPELNSSWDEAAQQIVEYARVNLGIAVATERGLVVPNIPDAGPLGLLDLAAALGGLTESARAGRTEPARFQGGTFTVTNIGVFGVEGGLPILNPGETGILAVGAVQRRPWEHEGGIALRQVCTLTLSFDHRVVDGERGSRFLHDVGELLADPALAFARN